MIRRVKCFPVDSNILVVIGGIWSRDGAGWVGERGKGGGMRENRVGFSREGRGDTAKEIYFFNDFFKARRI
jgi:hypothetical protein